MLVPVESTPVQAEGMATWRLPWLSLTLAQMSSLPYHLALSFLPSDGAAQPLPGRVTSWSHSHGLGVHQALSLVHQGQEHYPSPRWWGGWPGTSSRYAVQLGTWYVGAQWTVAGNSWSLSDWGSNPGCCLQGTVAHLVPNLSVLPAWDKQSLLPGPGTRCMRCCALRAPRDPMSPGQERVGWGWNTPLSPNS